MWGWKQEGQEAWKRAEAVMERHLEHGVRGLGSGFEVGAEQEQGVKDFLLG